MAEAAGSAPAPAPAAVGEPPDSMTVTYVVVNGRRVRVPAAKGYNYSDAHLVVVKDGKTYAVCTLGHCRKSFVISSASGIKKGPFTEHMKREHYSNLTAEDQAAVDAINAKKASSNKRAKADDDAEVQIVEDETAST